MYDEEIKKFVSKFTKYRCAVCEVVVKQERDFTRMYGMDSMEPKIFPQKSHPDDMTWEDWEHLETMGLTTCWWQYGSDGVLTLHKTYFTKKGVKETVTLQAKGSSRYKDAECVRNAREEFRQMKVSNVALLTIT